LNCWRKASDHRRKRAQTAIYSAKKPHKPENALTFGPNHEETVSGHGRSNPLRKHSWHKTLQRIARFHLVVPLKRSPHPPEFTARGVGVGMLIAMTPTIGIQMFMITGVWYLCRKLLKWDFSLLAGLGWTWSSNVFTMIPLYYLFYVTGQIMMGHWHDISGFAHFAELVRSINDLDVSLWVKTKIWMVNLVQGWGVPMFIGSIPWAIFSSWLGYRIAYHYVTEYRRRRAERMEQSRQRRNGEKEKALS
jgi:uncharacterized protein (DUF2062 family)